MRDIWVRDIWVSVGSRRFVLIFISLEHNGYEKFYSGNTMDTKESKQPQETYSKHPDQVELYHTHIKPNVRHI